ncbi:NAD(P)-dependent dehydrogenase (short-subunit alcohol dehydrogenase family) [Sphingopyxis panaciterrae]|uniref:SDR family NAD(P)-dependent oxidoreductase n=1 Tax=Sphingopyxis panaciterrae TaxID=363841 RepID=UPI001ABA94BF|nr:SDR family NAD(P)-dependent oxidoreductase [Sphingopyxis panaciterrae]NIJ37436.1 NAD(P)-dependent dehydrogenase (short-subunit alcohol dehydrogenase family) [Sphingopyxis panaciterrae]
MAPAVARTGETMKSANFSSGDIFDVSGSVVIVTGGASGLGLSIAEVMAANDARVLLLDIDQARLDECQARFRAARLALDVAILDVADIPALQGAIHAAAERYGRIDAVFANAGISAGSGPFTEFGQIANVREEDWNRVLQINLTAVFATIQAASIHMKRQRGGRIVVTSSVAGLRAERHVGYAYVATKAAVVNLVRHAAIELAEFGVCVNGIAPGPILTNIAGGKLKDPDIAKPYIANVPLARLGDPDEIKGLALLLGSRASSFITGTTIAIDGGMTAW